MNSLLLRTNRKRLGIYIVYYHIKQFPGLIQTYCESSSREPRGSSPPAY